MGRAEESPDHTRLSEKLLMAGVPGRGSPTSLEDLGQGFPTPGPVRNQA